ncbi:MAG: hypothetical protein VX660_02030, partial [Candidatus Thermoplasmatota archaeon]|nr:hypothetical protein [Candidatus Thermoplasmatota archaeon]
MRHVPLSEASQMDSSVRRTAGSQVQFEHLHLYLDMGASDSNAISVAVPMVSSIRCRHSEKISSGYSTILPVTPISIAGLRT